MCSPVWKALTPARSRRCSLLPSHSDIIRWYGGRLSPQLSLLYVILSGISEKLTITDCYFGVWGYVLAQNSADSAEIRHTVTSFPQLITDVLQESVSAQRISAFLQRADVQYLDESEGTSDVAKDDEPLIVVGDIAWAQPQETDTLDSAPFVLKDLDITFQRGTVTLIAGKFGSGKSLLLNALLGEVALLRGRISYAVSAVADPWQTETAVDFDQCLEGLAFVPQVS
jgi:ABC-type multidrug transport system fused ATPase/permease subunit